MTVEIRILLAEDHALVRAGLRSLLERAGGITVVAEASNGREALDQVRTHLPDIVLMDITMPELSGLQAVARIAADYPQVRIIVLSMHDNEEYVRQALQAGAVGYLLKDSEPVELELAVRAVARGGSYLSPSASRHLISDYVRRSAGERGSFEQLTPRQLEIVQLVAEGNTNQEIARELSISLKTVESHRAQLMARLDIHDVPGLVRYAIRMGLIPAQR